MCGRAIYVEALSSSKSRWNIKDLEESVVHLTGMVQDDSLHRMLMEGLRLSRKVYSAGRNEIDGWPYEIASNKRHAKNTTRHSQPITKLIRTPLVQSNAIRTVKMLSKRSGLTSCSSFAVNLDGSIPTGFH